MRARFLSLIALVACDSAGPTTPPPPDATEVLSVATDRGSYPSGGVGVVTITNKSPGRVVTANLCEHAYDRWTGEWVEVVPPPAPGACPQIFVVLRPGQAASGTFSVPGTPSLALHRLRFTSLADTVTGLLPQAERVSPPFEVR